MMGRPLPTCFSVEHLDPRRPAWTAIQKYLGSSSYWNSVILRRFPSKIVSWWGISPARQGTLHQYERAFAKETARNSLCLDRAQKILNVGRWDCCLQLQLLYASSPFAFAFASIQPHSPLRIFYSYFGSELESIFFNKHNFG